MLMLWPGKVGEYLGYTASVTDVGIVIKMPDITDRTAPGVITLIAKWMKGGWACRRFIKTNPCRESMNHGGCLCLTAGMILKLCGDDTKVTELC